MVREYQRVLESSKIVLVQLKRRVIRIDGANRVWKDFQETSKNKRYVASSEWWEGHVSVNRWELCCNVGRWSIQVLANLWFSGTFSKSSTTARSSLNREGVWKCKSCFCEPKPPTHFLDTIKMSGSFMRNSTIPRLLRAHTITNITDPAATAAHSVFRQQQQSRKAYFGFSNGFKRSKECNNELSPSSLLTSSFSSKAENAAFYKIGFIGWYLGMVKSRPILTKSATSSLIYIAADLSSQVM